MTAPTASPESRLLPGHKLGSAFEIVGVLGEGGTGVVYDALALPQREPIALKVIHDHLLSDAQIRGRFTREAAILHRLEGPHLSALLSFGELPDPRRPGVLLLYMALPKIDGVALDDALTREEPPSLDRALDVMTQILTGLTHAHMQGVIHRDLKPANVLLRGGTHAIVVDFGMAKIITGGGTGTTALTTHNMVFGTPEYMSPEQARGDELDARCDVYAAGVILYQMLTGTVPFSGPTPLSILTAHLTAELVPARVKAPERAISPALDAVVRHALARDPAERYASAGALSAAITHARSLPEDVAAVHPRAFSPAGFDSEEGHAPTEPAPIPTDPPAVLAKRQADVATVRPAPPPSAVPSWAIVAVAAAVSVGVGVLLSLLRN